MKITLNQSPWKSIDRFLKKLIWYFFKPKRDQCKRCWAQNNLSEEEKEINQHLDRKNMARLARDKDKE